MKIKYIAPLAMLVGSSLITMNANAITVGAYNLHNHPDGSAAAPLYGLRLDGLLGDSTKKHTFDFDHADSAMTLTWDGNKIVIDGQAFGGEDIGAVYGAGTTAVWDIHFEYTIGISQPGDGGVDDLIVNSNNANFGTISSTSLGSFQIEDKSDGTGLAFQFGDENGAGHRDFAGISGWGWLNHGEDCMSAYCPHIGVSDWLFTATVVPVPAAVWLFGSGLIGLIGVARRKKA